MKGEERQEYLNNLGALAIPPEAAKVYAQDTDESPCQVCGGGVRGNDGEGGGPWRRHRECASLVGYEPARLAAACRRLKVADLSPVDAALVGYRVPLFSEVHRSPVWTTERMRERMPWKHVDRKELVKAVKSLPRLRRHAGLDPSRCASGACGWCGVATSCGWHTSKQTWADGSRAPLCRDCHLVNVRHGRPTHPDDLPAALAEAITGVAIMLGEQPPPGLTPFCEVAATVKTGKVGEPWAHLPSECGGVATGGTSGVASGGRPVRPARAPPGGSEPVGGSGGRQGVKERREGGTAGREGRHVRVRKSERSRLDA